MSPRSVGFCVKKSKNDSNSPGLCGLWSLPPLLLAPLLTLLDVDLGPRLEAELVLLLRGLPLIVWSVKDDLETPWSLIFCPVYGIMEKETTSFVYPFLIQCCCHSGLDFTPAFWSPYCSQLWCVMPCKYTTYVRLHVFKFSESIFNCKINISL